jgi:SOS-response transcriptional repressor LexA
VGKVVAKERKWIPIGNRLRKAREDAGLLQREVAARVGKTVQAVNQWEAGADRIPVDATVVYSQMTGKSLDWLLAGREPARGRSVRVAGEGAEVPVIQLKDAQDIDKAIETSLTGHRTTRPMGPRAFALVVEDTANAPELMVGDTCVFDPDARPEPGKFVLALVGKDRTPLIRRLEERERGHVLVPANKAWGPKVLDSKRDGEIVAALVEYTRSA